MNEKTKHTPGPWFANYGFPFRIMDPDGDHLAKTYSRVNVGEEEANALLIAAAPDLLRACKALVLAICDDDSEQNPYFIAPLREARAAIERARGGEK